MLCARRSLVAGAVVLVGVVTSPAPAGAEDGTTPALPVAGVPTLPEVPSGDVAADAADIVQAIVDDALGDAADPEDAAPPAPSAAEDAGASCCRRTDPDTMTFQRTSGEALRCLQSCRCRTRRTCTLARSAGSPFPTR